MFIGQSHAILQKGTLSTVRSSYVDLASTMLQMPHALGGYGMTPKTIAQISAKVATVSRFFGLVGTLPPREQHLWLPNQAVQNPDT
jgi:hypothetical protein